MNIVLTPHEARVIGCLIEKEITTPEQYPLSLNALTNACNQRSNRYPVLDLDETLVQQLIDSLIRKHLVKEQSGYGSRVRKYQHGFCNTNFGTLKFSPQELGIVCELLLRGPQTPGELRTHAGNRLCQLRDVAETEFVLKQLVEREDGPFVIRLPREPGKRESRYAHLFGGEIHEPDMQDTAEDESLTSKSTNITPRRMEELETRVATLETEMAEMRKLFGSLIQ